MTRYGLATIFEQVSDGFEFISIDTPLHLTHVDVLEIDMEPNDFVLELSNHLSGEPQFGIYPTEDTFFGPNKDIPVTLIESTPELMAFHNSLLTFLLSKGAVFENPQYVGENYAPHISIYGSRRVELGKRILVDSVSIGNKRADVSNPPSRIIATLPLM